MDGICTVAKNGNSATVTLPAQWRKGCGIDFGDELEFHATDDGRISFRKREVADDVDLFERFEDLIESMPDIPWTRGDSSEDDRELLAERYA